MEPEKYIDIGLKRVLYMAIQEISLAAAFTLYYGKSLQHFGELLLAMNFSFFSPFIAAFSGALSGLTLFEWFGVGLIVLTQIAVAVKTTE